MRKNEASATNMPCDIEAIELGLCEPCLWCSGAGKDRYHNPNGLYAEDVAALGDTCIRCRGSGMRKDIVRCNICAAWLSPREILKGQCFHHEQPRRPSKND